MERVQAKLRRLILVSGATLGIGFLAVVFAVIFRVSTMDRSGSDAPPWQSTIELPAGAKIVATDVDGARIAVTVDGPEGRRILLHDLATGRRIGEAVLISR
jgi:hypothetical protein